MSCFSVISSDSESKSDEYDGLDVPVDEGRRGRRFCFPAWPFVFAKCPPAADFVFVVLPRRFEGRAAALDPSLPPLPSLLLPAMPETCLLPVVKEVPLRFVVMVARRATLPFVVFVPPPCARDLAFVVRGASPYAR